MSSSEPIFKPFSTGDEDADSHRNTCGIPEGYTRKKEEARKMVLGPVAWSLLDWLVVLRTACVGNPCPVCEKNPTDVERRHRSERSGRRRVADQQ